MKFTAALVCLLCAALLLAGCGAGSGSSSTASPGGGGTSSPGGGAPAPKKATAPNAPAGSKVVACSEGRRETVGLRATAVGCDVARTTMQRWERSRTCSPGNDSRSSCKLGPFRCQAVRSGRGAVVSCAKPGADVSFIAKAWILKRKAGPAG
jgi:hypothetical protein